MSFASCMAWVSSCALMRANTGPKVSSSLAAMLFVTFLSIVGG